MVHQNLFPTGPGKVVPAATTKNNAGGVAYQRSNEQALAQFAATGCFGNTFYVKAEEQLSKVLELAQACDPRFVAQCAVYSRQEGAMKDMPAMLCAVLAMRDPALLAKVFDLCIDNFKMVRNFVQIIRSGVVGRKSFPRMARRLIKGWFEKRTDAQLFYSSIGTKPSMADVIKMVHPKPENEARRSMLAYLIGRPVASMGLLPEVVQQFEAFKRGEGPAPDINFQFLSALPLTPEQWKQIARTATWQTLRMNLNTFHRHGCFADSELLAHCLKRLQDPAEIAKAKPMPYQLFSAFLHVEDTMPPGVRMALAQASDAALSNVPDLPANTAVLVDVSGSMSCPATQDRGSATSKMRCIDVAALIACAIVRKNPTARVVPFDTTVHGSTAFMRGSVLDSAKALAGYGGGGTNVSIALEHVRATMPQIELIVVVSDNESWMDSTGRGYYGTGAMQQWRLIQQKNPNAKIVCIDLTPNVSKQLVDEPNVANVGGFSDAVFDFIASFSSTNESWENKIKALALPGEVG